MELDKLLEEAKLRYPIGCKVKSLSKGYFGVEMIILDYKHDAQAIQEIFFYGHDYNPCVYLKGVWAEIVEYPIGYVNPNISSNYNFIIKVLKKYGIK